jgi:hypothetical protein
VLWNLGASLELMWVKSRDHREDIEYTYFDGSSTRTRTSYVSYKGSSVLFGMGLQTGFSFRLNPYFSLDLNGLLKFPFGTVDMERGNLDLRDGYGNSVNPNNVIGGMPPKYKSAWPFFGGIELGLTYWFPYRSRR